MKKLALLFAISLFSLAAGARAAGPLTVIKAGPVGEIASMAEANEVRVVFSEPMVVIGKVPAQLTVPWFHITPAVAGSFRWSGTTTLIFTPDSKTPLPYATQYDVTIDPAAKSVAGNALDRPYTFSFFTPTIKLLSTNWYRKGHLATGAVVIGLTFNQKVDPTQLAEHVQLRYVTNDFKTPEIPATGLERLKKLEPQATTDFEAKIATAQKAANSSGNVLAFLAPTWDVSVLPKTPELVVLETKPGIPPGAAIEVYLDGSLAKGSTSERSAQQYTVHLAPVFFVNQLSCMVDCNPDGSNEIRLRGDVEFGELAKAVTITDITNPKKEFTVKPGNQAAPSYRQTSSEYSLDDLAYSLAPAHTYAIRIDPSLKAADGQTLGYTFIGIADYTHKIAFISFGEGHGVWENSGGPQLPFYSRNFKDVQQWLTLVKPDDLVPTIVKLSPPHGGSEDDFRIAPDGAGKERKLTPTADRVQSYGINLTPVLGSGKNGLVWAAVQEGNTIPKSLPIGESRIHSTLVQVTNLGITLKDSPQNSVILVTRLDDGAPVASANVAIRTLDNKVVWSGKTDAHGIAVAPNTDLRRNIPTPIPATGAVRAPAKPAATQSESAENDDSASDTDTADSQENIWDEIWPLHFIVTAEKDGDFAYVASNWNDGLSPYDFNVEYRLSEADALLRGTVFADRGVYKLGEDVHFKTVLRSDTPTGMQLLPKGTQVAIVVRDSHDKRVDKRTITLNEWSSAEWTWKVPADGSLGEYTVRATVDGMRLRSYGTFLVAAYRRPDFRVDTTLGGKNSIAGTKLDGKVLGRYLFGSPMGGRDVQWTYSKTLLFDLPQSVRDHFTDESYAFLGEEEESYRTASPSTISQKDAKLNSKGELPLALETDLTAGDPYVYSLEGEVTDVSRQKIAGRASFRVDPAPWYIGVRSPGYFADATKGLDTAIVAVSLDGKLTAGVDVELALTQIQYNSVRQASGNGFYTWNTERQEVPAGTWTVKSAAEPAPLHIPLKSGGYFILKAVAKDADGRSTTTRLYFYALGEGYTAWERYDSNRIDLVPEKKTYRPGQTARIMIKSPWEHATAMVTTEREGIRTEKQFELTSTQQAVNIPITEKDIPNVYVSVVLVKGRTKEGADDDNSDPGKPSFRIGYTALEVEDATKRLAVTVKSNSEEYRPATKAKIEVDVKDSTGKATPSEVTLWAVDYGVLSLTAYQTPDVLKSIYIDKALQVMNDDSRQKIISRRSITPKGADAGGGGGKDNGPGTVRKDFRVLAFWLGSIATDKNGHLKTEVTLPESLTTYRIMAVAGDKASRFGWGQNEIKINKPVLLTQAFPRFLSVGDKAYFGAVIHSQLKEAGNAVVTIRSLDPQILDFTGDAKATTQVAANGSAEVRFDAIAKSIGNARVQMSVSMNHETDAFEDVIPVRVLVSPETVAAYGEAAPQAKEVLEIPADVVPTAGGMHVELSSTALVGLGEGARYLVDYPYGCSEQRSSGALALMLSSDLGDSFSLPGIDPKNLHSIAQTTLDQLPNYQCADGGFTYWPGECNMESPYLTSFVTHVIQRGQKMKYNVKQSVLDNAYSYLESDLAKPRPENEGWWPAYTAWQAFSVKVLTEGGRNEDSHINRLYGYLDRMPLFGIAYLDDALIAKGETGKRQEELRRRMTNAILPEGGSAHIEELNDPYLLWFWNSNIRSTAIVMSTLVRGGQDEQLVKKMARWMMVVRKRGRWGNTQENAWAMEALIDYYRKYESDVPDFTAVVTLGTDPIDHETFKGRTTEAKSKDFSMADVLKRGPAGAQLPLTFDRQGKGTLFYLLRLKYASTALMHDPLNQGFEIERHYALENSKVTGTSFKAGDLIRVTLKIRNTKERRFVAVTDPIPAGTEPVEAWFATTATALANDQQEHESQGSWWDWYQHGGFDHVERHDDHVDLFATRLDEGNHEFSYLVRATTAGTFVTSPTHAEEMYEPEVFGRTASDVVEVKK